MTWRAVRQGTGPAQHLDREVGAWGVEAAAAQKQADGEERIARPVDCPGLVEESERVSSRTLASLLSGARCNAGARVSGRAGHLWSLPRNAYADATLGPLLGPERRFVRYTAVMSILQSLALCRDFVGQEQTPRDRQANLVMKGSARSARSLADAALVSIR